MSAWTGGSKGKRVMSFSQMTTAAFSSGRKNVEELLATARRFWGRERQQAKAIKAGRALRAQLDFARYLQKRTADPQSYISPSPAKHRRRHRRNRFLLVFYPFRSSRRFLLQSAVLRPHRWLIIRRRDLARSIPISTSSTRLGSSLTISGARKGRRWL